MTFFLVIDHKFRISPLFSLFQYISPLFRENVSSPLLFQISPRFTQIHLLFTYFTCIFPPTLTMMHLCIINARTGSPWNSIGNILKSIQKLVTILSVPFCPCTILSIYHFVRYQFGFIPFCPYHFVRTVLSTTILSGHPLQHIKPYVLSYCSPDVPSSPKHFR